MNKLKLFALAICGISFLAMPTLLQAEEGETPADLAAKARRVLKARCWQCHNGDNSTGGAINILNDAEMIDSGYIESGSPDDSHIMQLIMEERMPPSWVKDRMPIKEANILRAWITAKTPKFPKPKLRPFIGQLEVLTQIRDYLRGADHEDRPYLRFYTLHNIYNNPQYFLEELHLYRAALSKTLNSVSWTPRISVPRAIDQQGLTFVIDIRDYDWHAHEGHTDKWAELLRVYPYGLKYGNMADKQYKHIDREISEMTGDCDLPYMRADWFIATGTRPELYHTLLEIPDNARTLENQLEVNIARNFMKPKLEIISRAGFGRSGVSGQNRLLERHDAPFGYYWKSYDFLPNQFRAKLTRFPLGPLNMMKELPHEYRFDNQAFVHDGGEIIFGLPNGMQGYMLTDGEDRRIDEGPIPVVSDKLKTSGTPAIVNATSCISCHRKGMIWFTDTIRENSAVFGAAEHHVKRLYPKKVDMDRLVQEDEDRFMRALKKAIGPFMKGKYEDMAAEDWPEPVGEVSRAHRLQYLDLTTIACELGLQNPNDLLIKVGEKNMKKLGLESLLKPGGVINRLEWEAREGVSLMQELARELRYTPFSYF